MSDVDGARENLTAALKVFADRYQLGEPPYDSAGAIALESAAKDPSEESIAHAREVLTGYNLYPHHAAIIGGHLGDAVEALTGESASSDEDEDAEAEPGAGGPDAGDSSTPASDGLDDMTFKDLQALAAEKGLKSVGVSKAALVESIRAASA